MSRTSTIYHRTHYGGGCFHQSFRPRMSSRGNVCPNGRDLLKSDYMGVISNEPIGGGIRSCASVIVAWKGRGGIGRNSRGRGMVWGAGGHMLPLSCSPVQFDPQLRTFDCITLVRHPKVRQSEAGGKLRD